MISCDRKIIKIWNQEDNSLFTNIEPKAEINDIEIAKDGSGMIFAPQEQEKIGAYFLPSLGQAPKWCSFLEQLTEELEESKSTTLYEDFKFLTLEDLNKFNAAHLIGTPALKAYMHGYFMELKAYQKLMQAINPFAYEEHKKKEIAKKLKETQEKRINIKQKKATVNVDYIKELEKRQKDSVTAKNKKKGYQAKEVLADSRFSTIFEDPDFAIDKNSENYTALKPTQAQAESDDDNIEQEAEIKQIY